MTTITTMIPMTGMNHTHHTMKPGMNGEHMNMHMEMMDMEMYFHADFNKNHILFKEWMPQTTKEIIFACLITMCAAIFYEGIKYLREVIRFRQSKQSHNSFKNNLFSELHLLQTLLHVFQYLLSYCLMLIAMTFQVYLFFSIIIGIAIGYFFITPLTTKLRAEYISFNEPDCC